MKAKLMETCSQISSKNTFEKLSVDAGFQKVRQALDTVGPFNFRILPRSRDFYPIENVFNFVKRNYVLRLSKKI